MRVPLAWLRDYVALEAGTDAIVEKLAMAGFPVESVERRPQLSGVVVGKIVKLEKHPNADRLQVCTLDVGGPAPLTIATAATNVAEGQVVPVATIGAQLVNLQIAPRKMRGIESQGMLVSANELGFEAEWFEDGILQLDPETPLGADAVERFGLNADVLDVEITANRVDAMSMIGIARELAVAFGVPLTLPETAVSYEGDTEVTVRLESPDCRRFVAQSVDGLRVGPAKAELRLRLALAGQRPISNLVDISNFVMLETGQPLHFYDAAKLAEGTIVVRDAREGETIRTLDGEERKLSPKVLVIADAREAQGIAGIKGGAASEVGPETREIVIEAATFDGPRIRRAAIALGVRTDASSRHEKGLPLALAERGAARAARLLAGEGGRVRAPRVAGVPAPPPRVVPLAKAEIGRLLGISVADDEIRRGLCGLGFTVETPDERSFRVTVPPWRDDVTMAADLVEEIARAVGYDRIESAVAPIVATAIPSDAYELEQRLASAAAALGYHEVVTLALAPAAIRARYDDAGVPLPRPPVEITNPLSEDQRFLRFSLLPALLQLAAREGLSLPFRAFEIGHVFGEADPPFERAELVWLLAAPPREEPPWHDGGFLTFKGEAEALLRAVTGRNPASVKGSVDELHPGKTAALELDGTVVAHAGALDPRLAAAFGLEASVYVGIMPLDRVPAYRVPRYVAPSRFPGIARDLALVVGPEVAAADVEGTIRATLDGIAREVRVFDEYRGPQLGADKKSLAVRVLLQRDDATMTDAEADSRLARVLEALRERLGATLRS